MTFDFRPILHLTTLFILAASCLAFSQGGALASVWLEQISGPKDAVVVKRGGAALKADRISEMMRLQPGDIINVRDNGTSLRVLLGNGTLKTIGKAQSPFAVGGAARNASVLGAMFGEVKKMLVTQAGEARTVAMITRGKEDPVAVLAQGRDENLVPRGTKALHIVWRGGEGPFDISLTGEENDQPLVARKKLSPRKAALKLPALASGEYELLVIPAKARDENAGEVPLTITDTAQLPGQGPQILDMKLDKRVEARLLIRELIAHPKWWFYAHSLAVRHNLAHEQAFLANKQ